MGRGERMKKRVYGVSICAGLGVVLSINFGMLSARGADPQTTGRRFALQGAWDQQFRAIARFVDELPLPPRMVAQGQNPRFVIKLTQLKAKFHRDFAEAVAWGYNGSSPGPTL